MLTALFEMPVRPLHRLGYVPAEGTFELLDAYALSPEHGDAEGKGPQLQAGLRVLRLASSRPEPCEQYCAQLLLWHLQCRVAPVILHLLA